MGTSLYICGWKMIGSHANSSHWEFICMCTIRKQLGHMQIVADEGWFACTHLESSWVTCKWKSIGAGLHMCT